LAGTQVAYSTRANAGDPDYQLLIERRQEDSTQNFVDSIDEALEKVENSRTILHVLEQVLSGYFK